MFQRAFSVSTREPAALLFAPGGHSPTGVFVAWCNIGTFVRLCFGVSCGIARARSFVCDHGRARRGHVVAVAVPCPSWPWRGRRALDVVASLDMAVVTWQWRPWVWPWRPPSFRRRRVVATRRRMLVFAMVYVVSALSWFAI